MDVHKTVKRFEVRNLITSIDALETPANETPCLPCSIQELEANRKQAGLTSRGMAAAARPDP